MSKKRNKNQRKKQVKARPKGSRKPPTTSSMDKTASDLEARWEGDYEAPKVQAPLKGTGGTISGFRDFMGRKEAGPDAGLLHKQRSCGELLIWLAGAAGLVYFLVHLYSQLDQN